MFQSTRPRGARHLQIYYKLGNHEFQSTRPRGARPALGGEIVKDYIKFQSTRPRGARRLHWSARHASERVSIHAPAWGATVAAPCPQRQKNVSIHAPAWGATWAQVGSGLSISGFNPRARVGRDCRVAYS